MNDTPTKEEKYGTIAMIGGLSCLIIGLATTDLDTHEEADSVYENVEIQSQEPPTSITGYAPIPESLKDGHNVSKHYLNGLLNGNVNTDFEYWKTENSYMVSNEDIDMIVSSNGIVEHIRLNASSIIDEEFRPQASNRDTPKYETDSTTR